MPEKCAVMIRVHCVCMSATKHRGVFLKHLRLWCALSILSARSSACADCTPIPAHTQGNAVTRLSTLLELTVSHSLQDETTCKNHPYLHASMWMAPLPHQDSHIIKGKSGAPLSGCLQDIPGHAAARVHRSLVSYFGSWTQAPVPMRT